LTTMLSPPYVASVCLTKRSQSALFDTSACMNLAFPPAELISFVTRSPPSGRRSLTTTLQPSWANRLAIPSPKPEPPPVTIAILSFSLMTVLLLGFPWMLKKMGAFPAPVAKSPPYSVAGHDAEFLIAVARRFLAFLRPDHRKIHSVPHCRQFRQDRHRDFRWCLAADAQPHRPVQPRKLVSGQVEHCKTLAALLGVEARTERTDIEGRRLQGFDERKIVELGVVGYGHDGAVRIEIHCHHHVVGHTAIERHAFDIPAIRIFLARIADRHVVVERLRHLCNVLGKLPSANDEQAPSRTVDGAQPSAIEVQDIRTGGALQRHLSGIDLQGARHQLVAFYPFQKLWQFRLRGDRLQNKLELAAAGQAKALRLIFGDAVNREFRLVDGKRFGADLVNQVVLDAAAGNRP